MAEEEKKEEKKKSGGSEELQPIIIKKIVKGGGHHGGAWKVAYADFVTAMMAFFLLLWLLNVTTDEQKNAISNYFDPTHPKVSAQTSGAGGVMGGLTMTAEGAKTSMNSRTVNVPTPSPPSNSPQKSPKGQKRDAKKAPTADPKHLESIKKSVDSAKEVMRAKEKEKFEETKKLIEQAIQEDPNLKNLAENLIVDITPEGLRIQIVDSEGRSMFASGSARMYEITRTLITKVTQLIQDLPNEISVRGHTDSVPYGKGAAYTNWELSTDRANSARRIMLESGTPIERVNNVVGKADTEHLVKDDPTNARNRRISLVLLNQELTDKTEFNKNAETLASETMSKEAQNDGAATYTGSGSETSLPTNERGQLTHPTQKQQIPVGTFRKTPGNINFP